MSPPNRLLPILSILTAVAVVMIGLVVYVELVVTLLESVGTAHTN